MRGLYFAHEKDIHLGEPESRLLWVELSPSKKGMYVEVLTSNT